MDDIKPGEFTIDHAVEIYSDYDGGQAKAREAIEGGRVVYAVYNTGDYCGDWRVVFIDRAGQWWEDVGGHCSCNGPEWGPRETTPEELLANPCDDMERLTACIQGARG